jgi:alpha-tubulin suppressor-like RCC1 family protein
MEYAKGVSDPSGKVLIFPDDSLVQKVQEFLGVEFSRMKVLKTWTEFVSYVSFSDPDFYDGKSGEYTNSAGLKVKVDFKRKEVTNLSEKKPTKCRFSQVVDFRGARVIPIRGLFMSQQIKDSFTAEFWSLVPSGVLELLASKVKPRDVLRLCSVNKKFLNWCTDSFYQNMLKVHYGIEEDIRRAKGTFIEMTREKVWFCGNYNTGYIDVTAQNITVPTPIDGLSDIVAVSAGRNHSLFLDRKGNVWSEGRNDHGQLGDNRESYSKAERIETLRNVIAISAGGNHSLFLDRDGQVWACGYSGNGQLGLGHWGGDRYSPEKIESLRNVIAISAGKYHSLFLDKDGQVWSCGSNSNGESGRLEDQDLYTPTRIETLRNIKAISAGASHSLFLDTDGQVWSCGANYYRQLGLGGTNSRHIPERIETLRNITAISAGRVHSLFLDKDGQVWGCGDSDLFGVREAGKISTPEQIETLDTIIYISAGESHSLFLDGYGEVWGCGSNFDHQLGIYREEYVRVPLPLLQFENVVAISAGVGHSLFIA